MARRRTLEEEILIDDLLDVLEYKCLMPHHKAVIQDANVVSKVKDMLQSAINSYGVPDKIMMPQGTLNDLIKVLNPSGNKRNSKIKKDS